MKNSNDSLILGIDHGYGNIKTANKTFGAGVYVSDTEPAFKDNLLTWNGKYYTIGEGHKEFVADKIQDMDYYVLTLAAVAYELRARGLRETKVHLAAGLPLTWLTAQKEAFRSYLLQNKEVEFSFNGIDYRVEFTGADIFPQGFAAIADRIHEFSGTNMLCDIGNGTMNVMLINEKKPENRRCFTEKFGTQQCVIQAKEDMNDKNMKLTKNAIIKTEIDETILTAISRKDFFNQMKKKGYTFNFTSRYSTVYHPAFKRPTRLLTLGDDYVPANLIKRVDESWHRYRVDLPPQDDLYKQYIGNEPIIGYAQTYVRFITIVEAVRKRPDNNRVAVKYLADEIRKLNRLVEQQNLLCGNDIETAEQLEAYKQGCKDELAELSKARNILRSKLKTAQNHGDENEERELKGYISDLSGRMKILRKNITVCERIEQKKPEIDEKLQDIKEIYQPTRNKN